jgi:hypothetical protein
MKKLIFVMNDHAEVGKTCFSSALVRAIRAQDISTGYLSIVGEEDSASSSSPKYNGTWNIIDDNDVNVLFKWCKKFDALVCDVQSGYADAVMELYTAEDLDLVLGDRDIELVIAAPQIDEAACNEEIAIIAEQLNDNAYYVIPRIPKDEFGSYLQSWEDSDAAMALDYLGAQILEVPRLTDTMQQALTNQGLQIITAIDRNPDSLPGEIGTMMKDWHRAFERQLEESLDFLLPETRSRHGFKRAKSA